MVYHAPPVISTMHGSPAAGVCDDGTSVANDYEQTRPDDRGVITPAVSLIAMKCEKTLADCRGCDDKGCYRVCTNNGAC